MEEQNNYIQNNVNGNNNNVGNINNGGNLGNTYNQNAKNQEEKIEEVIEEIQKIFNELSKTHSTNSTTEQITIVKKAVEIIESKPKLKTKIINLLQAGLIEALNQTLKHPAISIFIAVILEWKK